MKTVRDVMTANVQTVAPDATIQEAARLMRDVDCGAVPVCDGDRLAGIVTDRDIAVRAIAEGKDASCQVRDVMSGGVITCGEDDSIEDVAELMEEKQVRRIVVVDENKRLSGIVALADLALDASADELMVDEVLERVSAPSANTSP